MTYTPINRPRNVLSRVHSVKHDGGRYIDLLSDFTHTDKVLYTGLLTPDIGRIGFWVTGLTECTENSGAPITPKTVH